MSNSVQPPGSARIGFFRSFVLFALSRTVTYIVLSAAILILDLLTGRYLLFPILFVIPVALSAWFCSAYLAYVFAVVLPLGRLFIAVYLDSPDPVPYIIANALIRAAVLFFITYLISRTARQSKELQKRVDSLVTICAWSRTVEYQGEWISFEEYLSRRFNIDTSHGISPDEAKKVFGQPKTKNSKGSFK